MIVMNNFEHGFAIAKSAGVSLNPAVDQVISRVADDGRLLGGVIYQNYTGASVGAHVASFDPHWLNQDMLWVIFDYPFNQLKVTKLLGQVMSNKEKVLDFDKRLGFKEEVRIPEVFPDADLVVLSMRREDCRWLSLKPRSIASGDR